MMGLQALFRPEAVAVVGASSSGGKLGAVMARSLAGYGRGPVLVNSRTPDPANGVYASIADAAAARPDRIDLAVLCVPAAVTAQAIRDAAAAGVGAAVVCAGGFAESGGTGLQHQADVLDAVAASGIRLLGPNTSGFFVPGSGLTASFVPGVDGIRAGSVAVVAASGGVNHALSFLLSQAGVGVSLGVGLGNAVDVSTPDVLDYLRDDPVTTAVALHIESVQDGPATIAAVAALSAVKPVVALVVGRSDVGAFAQSHTGALATSWRTTRAVLRQAGAVLVDDENALVEAVAALGAQRLPPHPAPGVGIVTGQAGPGLLLVDALRTAGVSVPELAESTQSRLAELLPPLTFQANPVDTGRPDPNFASVLATVAADPLIDLLALYGLTEPDVIDLPTAAAAANLPAAAATLIGVGGPAADVAAVIDAARPAGIPVLTSPTSLARGVIALVEDAVTQDRRKAVASSSPRTWSAADQYDEDQAKALLDGWGVGTPDRRRCTNREQAHQALAELTNPVAVKILDASVLHKTEIGGVHLGVRSPEALDVALDALQSIGAKEFLVESMAPSGVDLVVGVRRDTVFGPVVLLGLGGTAAEVYEDVAIRHLPVSVPEVTAMVDELAARKLLDGWRGGPSLEQAELTAVVTALADGLLGAPTVSEIEINPLRLTGQGLIALDAVIISDKEHAHATSDH
jgi:acetyltransferase